MPKIAARVCFASFLWILLLDKESTANIRNKRFLTFPRSSPTRIQLIMGLGIPVPLRIESVTIGYVLKAEYYLPENASNYLNFIEDPFDVTTQPINTPFDRRRREADHMAESGEKLSEEPSPTEMPNEYGYDNLSNEGYERYRVPAVEVKFDKTAPTTSATENELDKLSVEDYWSKMDNGETLKSSEAVKQPQDLSASRWNAYKTMATLADLNGLNGRICVLRSICESAHAPFDYSNGIMGELLHILMTPSSTKDGLRDHTDNEYLRAEELGKYGAPCHQIFKECSQSVLEQFSGIYTGFKEVSKFIG